VHIGRKLEIRFDYAREHSKGEKEYRRYEKTWNWHFIPLL